MKKLTQILKLILLGPQPKDEWFEEWSKDPLYQWFQDYRIPHPRLAPFYSSFRVIWSAWPFWLIYLPFVAALFVLPREYHLMVMTGGFLLLLASRYRFRYRGTRFRTPARFVGVLAPVLRESILEDLWRCGFRGRDLARILYAEQRTTQDARKRICGAIVCFFLFISCLYTRDILAGTILVSLSILWFKAFTRYTFYTSERPFQVVSWPPSSRVIPGLRMMDSPAMKSALPFLRGSDAPVWAITALPFSVLLTMMFAADGQAPDWLVHFSLGIPILLSLVFVHLSTEGRKVSDLPYLEEAFAAADRDFDQWVRTELIGDEDAQR